MKPLTNRYRKTSITLFIFALSVMAWSLSSCSLSTQYGPFATHLSEETFTMFQKSQNFQNINFVNKAKTEEKSAASFLRVVYQYMTAKNPAPQPEKQLPFITLNADTFNEAPTDGYR
ncbi:MAG: hypothetical protein HON65_00935, partial [Rhodospirillales bacterium]|nr:hypothetical protein [Rhodospirillales bacterium]